MSLGENIKKARLNKKLTQQELAEAISNKENTYINTVISNWENNINKPDADTLSLLCNVLNVDANYLLDFEEIKKQRAENSNKNEALFSKYKDILTEGDWNLINTIIEQRKKDIDKEFDQE